MSHLDGTDLKHCAEVGLKAAEVAVAIIRRAASDLSTIVVQQKGKNDLVTQVDRAAQDAIIGVLSSAFPDHGILAEEQEELGPREVLEESDQAVRWIVDPLDGTTNFTRGLPPYAVSIGLEDHGEPVLGIIVNIPANEWFVGYRGGGVTLNGSPVVVSGVDKIGDSLLTTGFPYREFDNVDRYLASLRGVMANAQGLRRPGSAAVDLAYVACGRFDGFFETGLMPWDVAAGAALVLEAGGAVSSIVGSRNPVFASEIVATNGLIQSSLRQLVEGISPEAGRD